MTQQTPQRMFKLAMIQMLVEGGQQERNLARAEARIAEAAAHGARLALLPEVMDLGWTHSSARSHASEIPGGNSCRALCEAARKNAVHVCAGIVEREKEHVYNSAVIIDARGTVLLKHRKLNELQIAHDCYEQGDMLGVCHSSLGTLGLLICADANAEQQLISRALGYMGADMILSPASWAVPPAHDNRADPYGATWRNSYGPVAREYALWFAGVSNVGVVSDGPWRGWNCIGCSLLFDADGNEVLQGPYGVDADTILYADITLRDRPCRAAQWQQYHQALRQ